ncbi:MAG: hypothetical protein LBR87_00755 [Synergistaceae bacterium]|jgi:hypothetical protein|nr:hypothetical protein [Synergistaceae bacterium]
MLSGEKYTLTLKNQSSQFQKFTIFQTFHDPSESSVKPLPLAWIVGAAAPAGKNASSSSEFAWRTTCNVAIINSYHMGNELLSTNSVEMPVDKSGENGFAVTYFGDFPFGAPSFVGSIMDGEKGFLLIQSDRKVPSPERQYDENCYLKIGFSMAGKQVSVADLHPDVLYRFSLDPVYRIVTGEFYPGQIIGDDPYEKSYAVKFGDEFKKTIILKGDNSFEESK